MRLIDADKIGEVSADPYEEGAFQDEIRSQPTVEAIPIELIKSKINAILDSYPDGNEETEILCKLLYEWEKENDKDSE